MPVVRVVKIVHTLSAIGLSGGLAALMILAGSPEGGGPPGLRERAVDLFRLLLVPSMVVCVLSGLASMMVHRPYWNALWAWLKAALGLPVVQMTVRLEGLAAAMVAADGVELARLAAVERSVSLWLLAITAVHVVVGIWRPRLRGAS